MNIGVELIDAGKTRGCNSRCEEIKKGYMIMLSRMLAV
jgi:hypothetical protein